MLSTTDGLLCDIRDRLDRLLAAPRAGLPSVLGSPFPDYLAGFVPPASVTASTSGTNPNYAALDTYRLPVAAGSVSLLLRDKFAGYVQLANDAHSEWSMPELQLFGPGVWTFPIQTKSLRVRALDSTRGQGAYNLFVVNGPPGTPAIAFAPYRPGQVTVSDASGTITTGGTAQVATAANPGRHYLFVLNPRSATESLWVNVSGTAAVNGEATGSIELQPGQSWTWDGQDVPSNALSVIAATTGHAFTVTHDK